MQSCSSHAWRVKIVILKHKKQCILWGWCWMTWIWLLLKIECRSMGNGWEERDHLVNFSTAGRVLTFILLGWVTFYYQQLMQIFCLKSDVEHDAWCLQWQNTGVGIAGLVHHFWNSYFNIKRWNFVQNKTDFLIIHLALIIQYITLLPKCIKWISRRVFLKAFTHANTSLCHSGSLVCTVWTASTYSKHY